jgi:hypothetical protein
MWPSAIIPPTNTRLLTGLAATVAPPLMYDLYKHFIRREEGSMEGLIHRIEQTGSELRTAFLCGLFAAATITARK